MKNKMYLVTEAAGFLGGEVCRQFLMKEKCLDVIASLKQSQHNLF